MPFDRIGSEKRCMYLILLHDYKGMTLKAVADKMGMSYINAKVIHKKALSSLRLAMGT